MNRRALIALCDALGVQSHTWSHKRKVSLDNEALRVRLLERLWGPNQGIIRAKSWVALDKYIGLMARVALGKMGHPLAAAQSCIALGNHSRAEAIRLYNLPSRPHKRIMAALGEARMYYTKAAAFQDQYARAA